MVSKVPGSGSFSYGRRRARQGQQAPRLRQGFGGHSAGPRVLKLEWKLPARLRRPIRQELSKSRNARKQMHIVAGFERRPLLTRPPVRWAITPTSLVGESHTPRVRRTIGSPPYRGMSFAPQPIAVALPKKVRPASLPKKIQKPRPLPLAGERDVPYSLPGQTPSSKQRLFAPIEVAITPPELSAFKKLFTFPLKEASRSGKSLVIFLVGSLLLTGVFWNIRGASRGIAVLGSVEERAQGAYDHLIAAQAALAQTDFTGGEQSFADAERMLRGAREQLDEALASSKTVIEWLDVTGTARSGSELLAAGEQLTIAGQHVARGIAPLFNARLLAAEGTISGTQKPTLAEAIKKAQPEMLAATDALDAAAASLAHVDESRVPAAMQANVATMKQMVPVVVKSLRAFSAQSNLLLTVMGDDRERQYLFLFQNNHEIRPTGGFIGSIALVNVDKGVVEQVDVKSVYDPDGQLAELIAPPDPLLPITQRWYLRDANWFVDYETSARTVADFLEKEKGPTVDGVIAVTPEVIRNLLKVTGPIPMPAYDVVIDADNFVPLTQEEVTYHYDRERNQPKQFMADLTPLLLNRLFSASAQGSSQALGVLSHMIREKHLLVYFRNEELQQRVVDAGWGGKLPVNAEGMLSVVNANIGGHKTDQFIKQEIDYRLEAGKDASEMVVTIRRTHSGPSEETKFTYPDGEDPRFKDNVVYQRVLVPRGATLISASGFTSPADIPRPFQTTAPLPVTVNDQVANWQQQQQRHTSGTMIGQEAGYSFFANWMVTKPGETTVGLYRYRLPQPVPFPTVAHLWQQYSLHIVKQPGDVATDVRVEVHLPEALRIGHAVPSVGVTRAEDNELVYRGKLNEDLLVGVIYSRK